MFQPRIYSIKDITSTDSVYFTKSVNGEERISSSLEYGSKIVFTLHCDNRLAVKTARLILRNDKNGVLSYFEGKQKEKSFTENMFTFELDSKKLTAKEGLFFYRFELESVYGKLFSVRKNKFSRIAQTVTPNSFISPLDLSYDDYYCDELLFPLTVFDPMHSVSHSIKGAVIYHIFVDRFNKSENINLREDSVYNEDWYNGIPEFATIPGGDIPNNTHFGGNLEGIIQKLDYIKSLGADYIYLSPIFKAYSNHKYDTGDYELVDENFGGIRAFKKLLKKADEIGIKIILDGVFNHTGDDSRYFNKYAKYPSKGAYHSQRSPYYNWYDYKEYPDDYQCWWGVKCLPTIKKYCPSFWEYIAGNNGVIKKYAELGVKGFRLDVVDELDQRFLTMISNTLRKCNSDNCLIGEVWEDASTKVAYGTRKNYFSTGNLDGVINYPFRNAIIDFLRTRNSFDFANSVIRIAENYPHHQLISSMNVLSTHDTERIVSLLGFGDITKLTPTEQSKFKLSSDELVYAKKLQKLASILQFTLPGAPTLYYGDETSMEGGKDPFNRLCYPWGKEDLDMIEHYQAISKIHRKSDALKYGTLNIIYISDGVIAYERRFENDKCIVAINANDNDVTLDFLQDDARELISDKGIYSRLPSLSSVILI